MATHLFDPTHFHSTIGTHHPVLVVEDGDTIITSTLDCSGRDQNLDVRHVGVNPMSGPFAVSGAKPGDVLAVRFDKLTPSRKYGWSLTQIAPNVVDPTDALDTVLDWGVRDSDWNIDTEANTVTLTGPKTNLGPLTLPLEPMIGCFGVAPSGGQAISTATSGNHGGNMDFKGFGEGVTIYFPVAVDGALFHIGDGHAAQGCGEIAGTGVEISFDVEFTLNVIKGRSIQWPRAEDDTYLMAIGNVRPLDQALQHATSELIRWLKEDYEIDEVGMACLLGQCVEYRIGNVYDPAYTVVCRIAKNLLPRK